MHTAYRVSIHMLIRAGNSIYDIYKALRGWEILEKYRKGFAGFHPCPGSYAVLYT